MRSLLKGGKKKLKTNLPPFRSDQVWSLLKGGKIANKELIIVQHHVAYRLVCFRV